MPIAEFTLGDALLTVIEIFVFVIYFWILITIFSDLFRDHQLSGWGKAGWILVLFLVPFLGMLIYLIARGQGMRDRAVKEQADMRRHMDEYVRETAGSTSSVDELAKLSDLKDKGAISDEEFQRATAKLLA
jgi:ABC-type transport system involved in cytochrome bd biosynthesis fused ATPase/permease subunit